MSGGLTNDPVLNATRDFRASRSLARLLIFASVALLAILGMVAMIVWAQPISEAASAATTRRAYAAPLLVPVAVILGALVVASMIGLSMTATTVITRLSNGARISAITFGLTGGDQTVTDLHQRFSTGDPSVYLPLAAKSRGTVRVGIYRDRVDRCAFVTIFRRDGAQAPLIELRGPAYTAASKLTPAHFAATPGRRSSADPHRHG